MSTSRQETGNQAEAMAARYLETKGYRVIEKNVWLKIGEIDLVTEYRGKIVLVEVKGGKQDPDFSPAIHFDARKQAKLLALSKLYLARHFPNREAQIDLLVVSQKGSEFHIDHVEDVIQDSVS